MMMRKTTLLLAATAALSLGAGAASAQVWMPIIERQAIMNDRIDAGLASGEITSVQASAMRADLAELVALEGRYRYGGLSAREKLDLDRQYAAIHDGVQLARTEGAEVAWVDIEIQINELRWFCQEHAPDRLNLFEMVYASRFRRLWETWSKENEPREWDNWEQIQSGWEENINHL